MVVSIGAGIKRSILVVLSALLILAGQSSLRADTFRTPLTVDKADGSQLAFEVELAITDEQRRKGLMFREHMEDTHGMLFIFPDEQPRSFWMMNTLIPLDIIFLRADGTIINIVAEAEPKTETQRRSDGAAKAVFEINGGLAARLGLKAGDVVRHALLGNMKAAGSQ